MAFRINTNVPSISAQRSLNIVTDRATKTLNRLSSGNRINQAADDAAGLAISEKLKSQVRSLRQANRNANDGISLIQTAEGGLNEVTSILTRLRELSIQSASDTVGEEERSFSDLEFQNLMQEIERISQVTEFNGKKLLNGTGDHYDFQIGMRNNPFEDRISYDALLTNSTLNGLAMNDLNVKTKEDSRNNLESIDKAIGQVSGYRANLGAVQNRLVSTSTNIETTVENISAANSRIRDTDYAEITADNARDNIIMQAGTSVLAQANTQGAAALKLID